MNLSAISSLVFGVCWCLGLSVLAQTDVHEHCATASPNVAFDQWLKRAAATAQKNTATSYTLPVIVHVLHHGEAVGSGTNLSKSRIYSQLEVLNQDYQRQFGTRGYNTDPVGADAQIFFCPVQYAPNGDSLPEAGIHRVRVDSLLSISPPYSPTLIRERLLPKTIWNPERYLNIWVTEVEQYLGFAQFPDSSSLNGIPPTNNSSDSTDGVVINYKQFGITGIANAKYNYGRTTTHEMGHFLGLRHIWGDGGCDVDDFCEDTPLAGKANMQCDSANHSCGLRSMDNNYMDYTPDRCMNIFTQCQVQRMHTVLQFSPRRRSLSNAVPCGKQPQPPTAVQPLVAIFPNPTAGAFTLHAENMAGATVHITLYNAFGQMIVAPRTIALAGGKADATFQEMQLAAGIYWVRVVSETFTQTLRLVVE